jgi:dihydropyrimidine dehydrogenase (NAD+) subunit PreT
LGAEDVHIVYRRGQEQMSAFQFEYEHARLEGVQFLWWTQPTAILGGQSVEELQLTSLTEPGLPVNLPVDMVVLAIGQASQPALAEKVERQGGRIVIDRVTGQTSSPKYFSGGDCTNGGREVVDAVADGKRAGIGIAAWLEAKLARA